MKNLVFILSLFLSLNLIAQQFELGESIVGYDNRSSFICFTDNDSIVLSGTFKGEIEKWNVESHSLLASAKISNNPVTHLEYNGTRQIIYVANENNELLKLDYSTLKIIKSDQFNSPIKFIYNTKRSPCFVGLKNGELYQVEDSNKALVLKSNTTIESLIFNIKNGALLVNDGKSINSYNIHSKRIKQFVKQPTNSWFSKIIPYQSSKDTIISISENGHIHFWDMKNGKLLKEIQAKNDFTNKGINGYSRNLITGFYKNKSLLFSLNDYNLNFDLNEEIHISNTLVCSHDQKYIITSDLDGIHKLRYLIGYKDIKKFTFQKRDIKLEDIAISGGKIKIDIWDHEEIDGDRISLNLNDVWLTRNHLITEKKKTFHAQLNPGTNTLIFHAENLGKFPPNTCAIVISTSDGQTIEKIMRSDLKESSGLNLIYEPKNELRD